MKHNPQIESLFNTFLQLGKIINQRLQESYEERTATVLQYSALQYVKEQRKVAMSEVAKSLQLSKSSATQLIERLAKAGFVERTGDESDRRITWLSITESGSKELINLRKNVMIKMETIFSKIPREDLEELIRIHTKLLKSLQKYE